MENNELKVMLLSRFADIKTESGVALVLKLVADVDAMLLRGAKALTDIGDIDVSTIESYSNGYQQRTDIMIDLCTNINRIASETIADVPLGKWRHLHVSDFLIFAKAIRKITAAFEEKIRDFADNPEINSACLSTYALSSVGRTVNHRVKKFVSSLVGHTCLLDIISGKY